MTEVVSIAGDGEASARAALERCVGRGGVAIFPADTVYGLACDPLDAAAVARIDRVKGRPSGKPAAVLYFSPLAMRELLGGLGPKTRAAMAALLPGAVTLVLENPERRYPLACGADPSRLGVRLIEGPLSGADTAVLQTSANRTGEEAPRRLSDVDAEILAAADVAVDGGEVMGEASSVVDISSIDAGVRWEVLREGAVPASELDRVLGPIVSP